MPEIQYKVGGMTSGSVDELSMVLVKIPGTDVLRVTDTYANQALPGYQVMMALGDTKKIATAIMSDVMSNSTLEEDILEAQADLEGLGKEVDGLKEYNYRRAQPMLPYAQEGRTNYEIERKIQNGQELTNREIDALVSIVPALRRVARARSPIKDAVVEYFRSGQADNQTLFWLASNIDPVYGRVIEYEDANARKQQMEQAYENLEQALIQSIDAIKSGENYQGEIEFVDTRINVKERLRKFTGAEPGSHFLLTIDDVVEGENKDSFIVPFQYRGIKGRSLPEELRPSYMPVERFGQIISRFDRALAKTLIVYARQNQEIVEISKDYNSQLIPVSDGLFVRALFPEEHEQILALYSDARLMVTKDEMGKRMMDIIRNERAEIPGVAAEYFGIPKEQIRLEELVSLQSQLMPILPMPAYVSAETDVRLQYLMMMPRRYRAQRKSEELTLKARHASNQRQLQRDFNVNQGGITKRTEATIEEVIQLFGEEFGFIRDVELKEGDEG